MGTWHYCKLTHDISIGEVFAWNSTLWSKSKIEPFPCLSMTLQSIGESNLVEVFTPLLMMMWSFVMIFGHCELGQSVDNEFDSLRVVIWNCDWYLLPHKWQRMFVIIIGNAQEPKSIRGFGNIECTRESFKRVNLGLFEGNAWIMFKDNVIC